MNRQTPAVRYPLTRPDRLPLDGFAGRCGLHPERVRKYVALGLLPAHRDVAGRLWLEPGQLATVARIERLRTGLSLNYAALGLVIELLDRIGRLEATLRTQQMGTRQRSAPPWT